MGNQNESDEEKIHLDKFKEVSSSVEYRQEMRRVVAIKADFLLALSAAWAVSSRDNGFLEKSMVMRGLEDISESAVLIGMSIENSVRNVVRRELRYLLEMSVKALIVDQNMATSSFEDRAVFMDRKIKSAGIDDSKDLRLSLIPGLQGEVIGRINSLYYKLSEYVHPSVSQIRERVRLSDSGVRMGFDSVDEIKKINDVVFDVYSLILVIILHAIATDFTGDLMLRVFDSRHEWRFHGNKYVAAIDAFYDYKDERKSCINQLKQIREERVARGG